MRPSASIFSNAALRVKSLPTFELELNCILSKIDLLMYQWRSGNFKREGAIISTFFSSVYFFGRTNLRLIEKQERL